MTDYLLITENDILLNKDLNDIQVEKYNNGLYKLIKGKAIQYLIGKVNFYGYDFVVNPNVLIPRFETELLVKETIDYCNKYFPEPNIIDLGCGSGVIGITIKKEIPQATITCLDIDQKALEVTKTNSENLKAKIEIIKGNMLNNNVNKYDIIISNPPYIGIKDEVEAIVLNNEPHKALFANNNGLYFYEQILKEAKKNLNEKSMIAFEIGCNQASAIVAIGKQYFPAATYIVKKDMTDKDRYLFIQNNL